jgi:LysM repeat protein
VHAAVSLISLLLIVGTFVPAVARASVLSAILASIKSNTAQADTIPAASGNVQTMSLLKPAMNIDPSPARGGGDITIVDDSALLPEEGPSGTMADIEKPKNSTISTYVVQSGDSLSAIAQLFNVSPSTILWANDLTKSSVLKPGMKLTILPITGVKYTVKKGDTIASIARKYGGNATEIDTFNGIDDSTLIVGTDIIIPDGEIAASAIVKSTTKSGSKVATGAHGKITVGNEPAHNVGPTGTASQIDYYIAPLAHYTETQGIHGYNAVDLAAPTGTAIMAAADGDVIVAKSGGYNGGYGSYVVIQHDNGSQTLYGHMSRVTATDGESVSQGQIIGYVGSTGLATGPHVHFEIRNGIRNPF